MSKLLLIDGHSILNRAFYGVPDLTNSSGLHTNAVYGFLNILFKIMDEEKPDYLAVAFDLKEPTFRHKMFEGYKGTRKPMPAELHEQVPVIKDVLHAMNIKTLELPGYEADDILGTMSFKAEKEGLDVRIVSGDRDLLQLATKKIMIRIPKTKKGVTEVENYFEDDVKELYGVTPTEFIDMKALMGDSSDNIPGVKNIGEKTAANIIKEFGSIENAYEHAADIKPERAGKLLVEDFENAKLSKILATIDTASPLNCTIDECDIKDMFNAEAFSLMQKLEFKSFLQRFDKETNTEAKTIDVSSKIRIVDDEVKLKQAIEAIKVAENISVSAYIFKGKKKEIQLSFDFLGETPTDEMTSDRIYVNIYDGENIYIITNSDKLTYDEITNTTLETIRKSKHVISADIKKLLKLFDFTKEYYKGELRADDVAIAAYLINPLKDSYNADDIARDFLGEVSDIMSVYKTFPKDSDTALDEAQIVAIATESYIMYEACDKVLTRIKELDMYELYREVELPLAFALHDMECEGIRVDRKALREYGDMLKVKIEELLHVIYEQIGEEFNINSPKQLGEILFVKMGIPGGKKTKTGYSTSADVLLKLAEDYPVINDILEYRQLTKLNSTYAEGLDNYISEDGRIHGTFNQTITATGRISSTEPNLQNIPIRMDIGKKLRQVFVPKDGYSFIDADYSQIELRIMAHMSGDENLIEAYNSGKDIHRITASKVFETPIDEVTNEQRSNAKAVNFGIIYGISAYGLSEDISISRKLADTYIKQYFQTYPSVKEFLDRSIKEAKEKGYVRTLYKRIRPIPELKSSNFMQKSFGERIAMNSPIQGTAADIMKIAMINVAKALREGGYKAKIVLQVHDELLIEAPDEEIDTVKALVEKEMHNACKLKVSLDVGIGVGKDWLDAH